MLAQGTGCEKGQSATLWALVYCGLWHPGDRLGGVLWLLRLVYAGLSCPQWQALPPERQFVEDGAWVGVVIGTLKEEGSLLVLVLLALLLVRTWREGSPRPLIGAAWCVGCLCSMFVCMRFRLCCMRTRCCSTVFRLADPTGGLACCGIGRCGADRSAHPEGRLRWTHSLNVACWSCALSVRRRKAGAVRLRHHQAPSAVLSRCGGEQFLCHPPPPAPGGVLLEQFSGDNLPAVRPGNTIESHLDDGRNWASRWLIGRN